MTVWAIFGFFSEEKNFGEPFSKAETDVPPWNVFILFFALVQHVVPFNLQWPLNLFVKFLKLF